MPPLSSSLADLSFAIADIVAAAAPQVVEVQSHRSLASGFVWRDGFVVTADETLADEGTIQVELHDGTVHDARLVGRDAASDIALLAVEGARAQLAGNRSEPLRPGELALIVAAAESVPLTAFGMIATAGPAWQSMRGGTIDARLEMDIRLRRRAEGGLALDCSGRAIGMAVRGPRGRTLVIPTTTIDRIADQLAAHGRVAVAYLGVALKDVPLKEGGGGAIVMTLDADGPAAAAGLQQGDIIVSWQGERMHSAAVLLRTLRAASVGSSVTLGLQRGGAAQQVDVTIGDKPAK